MKVLVACEFSGTVRNAFLKQGHDAISCDLLPTTSPGPHYIGDVRDILNDGFDLLIAHPPCTYLCASGMHWTTRGLRDPQLTKDALDFVSTLLDAPIEKIALENPVGCISTFIRKPDQIIQPWMFGHDASKATCLWLENLPTLKATKVIPPAGYEYIEESKIYEHRNMTYARRNGFIFGVRKGNKIPKKLLWENQTPSGQNKLGPSEDRWADRSITYQGIADAMATQWS